MDDAGALRESAAQRPISRAEEKQIARALSPDVAWPTLALALALPAALITLITLGARQIWPLWACTPLLTLFSYAHYTLVHESVHGNVVARNPQWAWINTVVGWIGATGMGLSWPYLQRTHVLHHSHTNSDRDPDIFVKGSLAQLVIKWAVNITLGLIPLKLLKYLAPRIYARVDYIFTAREMLQISAITTAHLIAMTAFAVSGHFLDWLMLWFLPTRLGILILNIFFQWLPHYPFDRTDRYGNTRVSLWLGGTWLTLQQNLHLMHHLWPSVPFYNYARLFRALRPVLIAEGSRIEGLGVGPWQKSKA
ncbi:fatty acid desaturase [Caulobacter segnis]|uniref:Fatty acid desaturase domain-containing protein n=1 Tax=Caulobacter segnis TaxID=88688 RepID=A0A2W5VDW6_9CAUL|nr:fatty acid desaturase [Caulobacter segnis]PZR36697.1 MAG: hypothetical protein DI526_03085 [Caulobacter segnis]